MDARFDILGIGNAMVDVVAPVDEEFLTRHAMTKGAMTLIDATAAERIYAAMPAGQESSGGSAANTCAVAAALGARVAYFGCVADDQLGQVFRHDIVAGGVHFPTPPLAGSAPTARCLIAVTPDAQRTMNTYLGACVGFGEAQVDAGVVAAARVTYLEGYLFDPPAAQAAFRRAAALAHEAGRSVALSLSDPFCVGRHRDAFRDLVRTGVDILFANEAEIGSLYGVKHAEDAVALVRAETRLAVLTMSERGSLVVTADDVVRIAATPTRVADTTGAGDAYAAGFLTGLTGEQPLAACGALGAAAAAAAIAQVGARPPAGVLRALV